ncbi:RIP metalloprotease RseP [Patescibacteria group bacterium]|nr:RIP metalloprotease RseP [Patescibacteria group bacterium]
MFTTIIVFLLILGLIVFVHELGHFILAKRAGIKVEEFGFGFPPRIFGIKKGETIYSLNLLPLGGFVKIFGEDGKKESDTDTNRAFYSKSIGTRAKILVAGVTMNILLAILLLGIGHWIGLPAIVEGDGIVEGSKVQIVQVSLESPASEAEIKMGDTIREFRISNSEFRINTIKDVQGFTSNHKGDKVIIVIERGDQVLEKEVVLRAFYPEDEGSLGVALARTAIVSYPWYQSLYKGVVDTINLTWLILVTFVTIIWQLITTGKMIVDVAGPVGIFNLTGQVAQLGFIYILQFTAILNINLAIINVLPFPALDGGRLLFLAIEKIKGSPISQKIEGIAHTAGFAILIILMIAVTWRDILRIF